MIPLIATVRVGARPYWIPLAILWILLAPFVLLLLPLALARVNPFRVIGISWQILTASKDSVFEMQLHGRSVEVSVL